jgi:hypothetical protein
MTKKQALFLLNDWGKNLREEDYCENIYMSIKGVGTKVFKNCNYHDTDTHIFIWTKEENFMANKKELGDFVVVPRNSEVHVTHQKVI